MATYYDIFGQKVQYLSSDPSDVQVGQVWYNSTSNTAKVEGYQAAAWSTSGNFNTTADGRSGAGTQTAGLVFLGRVAPYPTGGPETTNNEEYDGTSWTEVNNLSTKRTGAFGGGTQTAAVAAGGYIGIPSSSIANTENYDGSTWTGGGSLNTGRAYSYVMVGTQGAGMVSGGYRQQTVAGVNSTELYDGSIWATANAFSTPNAYGRAMFGATQTAAIATTAYQSPGPAPGNTSATESWDGTCWTSTTSYPAAYLVASGFGTQTLGLVAGGGVIDTNTWDGTSWTATTSLPATRNNSATGTSATSSAGFVTGGNVGGSSYSKNTVNWDGAGQVTKTITTS